MGKRIRTGGAICVGRNRIRFDFNFEGRRYRPSVLVAPTEANLRRARERISHIKERIAAGTFSFAEEFPNFRDLDSVPGTGSRRTCDQVFDAFLVHCESRLAKADLAPITVMVYRRILNTFWRPKLGALPFLAVRYSTLVEIADEPAWSKKTYNNAISVLHRAFRFGYRDYPDRHDPAQSLKCARIRKKERQAIDPFSIQDAERLIQAIHRDWGPAQGNYDEFRFFTGLRPSEQIALKVSDFDSIRGTLMVDKARVAGIDKSSTKTGDDRRIELCPRALNVLSRQIALRDAMVRDGTIDHDYLFFKESGEPIRNLQYTYGRWRASLKRLPNIRYRKPYCARHTSVSWNLMLGRSPLWVAKQHGHSIATMLRAYAAWTDGATENDLELIKRAMLTAPFQAIRESTPPEANAVPKKERLRRRISALDSPLTPIRQQLTIGLIKKYLAGERHPHRPPST